MRNRRKKHQAVLGYSEAIGVRASHANADGVSPVIINGYCLIILFVSPFFHSGPAGFSVLGFLALFAWVGFDFFRRSIRFSQTLNHEV